jgi:hypothetical protein
MDDLLFGQGFIIRQSALAAGLALSNTDSLAQRLKECP